MDSGLSIVLGVLVVLLAGFTQGLTSFGFALVSVPFLSMLMPMPVVVPLVVLLSLGTNLFILVRAYRQVEVSRIWILVVSSLVAAPLGTLALKALAPATIQLGAGVLIVVVSLLQLARRTFPLTSQTWALVPVGLLSGFLNGSISLSGPPVALFLSHQNTPKEVFRANLTMYAVVLNVFTLGTFAVGGLLGTEVLVSTLWLVPSIVLGVAAGVWAVPRISQAAFQRVALVLILVSGMVTLGRALKLF